MLQFENAYFVDLDKGPVVDQLRKPMHYGDDKANRIGVTVTKNGQAVTLSGECTGKAVLGDDTWVMITNGVVDGNEAYIELPSACYSIEGPIRIFLNISSGDTEITLLDLTGYVKATQTDSAIDPDHTTFSVSALEYIITTGAQDQINAIEEAGAAQMDAIEDKGEEVIASIPSDYTSIVQEAEDTLDQAEALIDAVDDIVLVQSTEPVEEHNKIWVDSDDTGSVQVPTTAELNEVAEDISDLKSALNYSLTEITDYSVICGVFNSNSITYWNQTAQPMFCLPCKPNETYEITKTIETPSYRMCYITEKPAVGVATYGYKLISAPNYNRTDTFVTGAGAKYLMLQFGTYSGDTANLKAGVSVSKYIYKELDTINGELDTINGELDTINGELDTINGELDTINGELDLLVISDLLANPVDKFPVDHVRTLYDYSTFTGWACPIGNPTNFDAIQFVVANRSTENYIESIRVQICEVNKSGTVLADVRITDAHVPPSSQKTMVFHFPLIENEDEVQLYFSYSCDQIVNMIGGDTGGWSIDDYGTLAYTTYTDGNHPANSFQNAVTSDRTHRYKPDVKVGLFKRDIALTELQTQQIEELVSEIPVQEATVPRIILPNVFHAVVGDEFQLFYRGIVEHPYPYIYNIQFSCNIGRNTARYFTVIPTAAQVGDHTLTVRVRDMADKILAEATTIIRVHAVGSSPATEKTVLCIGDSLTAGGVWPEEMMRRLTASDGTPVGSGLQNIVSIGTVHKNQTSYEGYGGWTWSRYISAPSATTTDMWVYATHDKDVSDQHSLWKDANNNIWQMETIEAGRIKFTRYESHTGVMPTGSGTLTHYENATHTAAINFSETAYASGNPFWDATDNEVDFVKYCENNGFSGIDYVVTLLTWNSYGAFHPTPEDGTIQGHVNAAKTLFRRLHEQYPNAKVKMMGIQLPSLNGGTGQNYGANSVYSNWYGLVRSVMGMNLAYKALADDEEFSSYVEFVDLSAQFDSEHNMPHSTKPVNTRSTETEEVGTNGVHPSTVGYLQIGDAAYRAMMPEFGT